MANQKSSQRYLGYRIHCRASFLLLLLLVSLLRPPQPRRPSPSSSCSSSSVSVVLRKRFLMSWLGERVSSPEGIQMLFAPCWTPCPHVAFSWEMGFLSPPLYFTLSLLISPVLLRAIVYPFLSAWLMYTGCSRSTAPLPVKDVLSVQCRRQRACKCL